MLPGQLDEADEAMVASEVGVAELADRLGRSAGVLLTAQTTAGQPGWDAVQSVTDGGNAIIFAYQHDPGVSESP